jgi:hypothetical protein
MNKPVINCNSCLWLLIGAGMLFFLSECKRTATTGDEKQLSFPPQPNPKGYVCYRTPSPINPDGVLDEQAWNSVPWTDNFVDIEGDLKPLPKLKTHAKLLWDDQNLYIGAELDEPHVWATLRQKDTIIFFDNDFEVFIDPDGDTQAYYELEVNALGTPWDLLMIKPYRDGGPAVNGWDISGLKVGTHVAGTINNPDDTDTGWSVEITIPLSTFREWSGIEGLPEASEQWRIDFSRVEWRTKVENGLYKKEINPQTGKPFPEDNWVWSPQGRINMHMPEMWGYLQFSSVVAGAGTEEFIPDKDLDKKWALRLIYYAENEYFKKRNTYSSNLSEIGLKSSDLPENLPVPVINSTRTTFECYLPDDKQKNIWTIYNDGRLILQTESVSVK